jgi:putative chitobiose transport system permease protein
MKKRTLSIASQFLRHLPLLALAVVFVFPLFWLLATALKPKGSNIFVYPPQLIPRPATLENFIYATKAFPFLRFALNSLIISGMAVVINIVLCAMAAYPLARLDFPGKNAIFYAVLSTMIVPFHALMIGLYILCLRLKLANTYFGAILPYIVTAFGVFLMRQAFASIPSELEDAARIDGASDAQIFLKVMLPLVQPAMGTVALFTFVSVWNALLWPVIILSRDKSHWTLQQGLATLSSTFGTDWFTLSAASVLALVPIVVIFLFLQRFFLEEHLAGALKG